MESDRPSRRSVFAWLYAFRYDRKASPHAHSLLELLVVQPRNVLIIIGLSTIGMYGCGKAAGPAATDGLAARKSDAVVMTVKELEDLKSLGPFKPEFLNEIKGKTIEVSGVIRELETPHPSDLPKLTIGTDDGASLSYIYIHGQTKDYAARFAPEQTVTLQGHVGKFKESEFLSEQDDIIWKIVDAGPNPARIVTAADLAKEFVADAAAVNAKYIGEFGGHPLYVIGEIRELGDVASDSPDRTRFTDDVKIVLNGQADTIVTLETRWKPALEKLKIGDKVQILGEYGWPYDVSEDSEERRHPNLMRCVFVETPLPVAGVTYAK